MKPFPTVDQIDTSKIPNEKLAKLAIEKLLTSFASLTEEERIGVLNQQRENREGLVMFTKQKLIALLPQITLDEAQKKGESVVLVADNIDLTAKEAVDAVIDALSEVYPAQD